MPEVFAKLQLPDMLDARNNEPSYNTETQGVSSLLCIKKTYCDMFILTSESMHKSKQTYKCTKSKTKEQRKLQF